MTQDNRYNGWKNYATWRINLEIFDDYDITDFYDDWGKSASKLADYLENYVDEMIFMEVPDGLAKDYARAFLQEVSWFEIASALIEAHEWEINANDENTREDYDETV